MKKKLIISAVIIFFSFIIISSLSSSIVEQVAANEVVVIQDPIDGELHFHFTPGLKMQSFGSVTKYKKESQFWFSAESDQGKEKDESIRIRFNDFGAGKISGSVRWQMPIDNENMSRIHTKFGSQQAVEQQLMRTVMEKAVYMTGPLMSSKESNSEKRNDLIFYISDQASKGVYKTNTKETKGIDPLSGKEKTVTVVEIVQDTLSGEYKRQEQSPLQEYGVKIYNLSLNQITYDEAVQTQIAQQQKAIQAVQLAKAKAKEAEQDAIKAEKEGQARAAQAKWEQEVIKAKMVTEAEQKKEVAKLGMEEAEFYKNEQRLKGEGEAARKKLVMQADGALDKKLQAWIEVNQAYAQAMKEYQGDWVPGVVMGGNGSNSTNGANDFMNLLMMKTAKDLSLDMKITKGNNRKTE